MNQTLAVVNFQSAKDGLLSNFKELSKKILLGRTLKSPDRLKLLETTLCMSDEICFSSLFLKLNFRRAMGIGSVLPLVISILNSEKTKKVKKTKILKIT